MKLTGIYDADTLHRMGALSVCIDYQNNETTVEPDIDMTSYDAVKGQIESKKVAKEAEILQKETDFNNNLPTWQQVSGEIDGITALAGAKIVLKKIARVVYWLAKNQLA